MTPSQFVGAFIYVIFITIIGVAVYFGMKQQYKAHAVILEQQALKRGGTVRRGSFFYACPRLTFMHGGIEVVVRNVLGGRNSPPYTFLECKLDYPRAFSISVSGKMSFAGLMKVFGGQDIVVNNPAFDDPFIVRGSDEMIVRNFLSSEIQERLLSFKESNPYFSITKDKFVLHVTALFKTEQQYDVFIETGLALINQALAVG